MTTIDQADRLTVDEWADKARLSFVGADPEAKAIADFVRMGARGQ